MKKKFVVYALCAAMVLSMVGCSSSDSSSDTTAAADTTVAAEETTGAADDTEATDETTGEEGEETEAADSSTTELSDDMTVDEMKAYASEGMETSIECDPIEISLACSGTVEGTAMGYAVEYATEAVSEWTNGNFVVTFYPGGELGSDTELIESVQLGTVDIFTGSPSSQGTLIPDLNVLDIGGLYTDIDSCNTVLDDMYNTFASYYEEKGLHLSGLFATEFRILTSSKPIETADDLQGLNIRVQDNTYHMTFWSELGCNATPLAFGELYIALQQGMMDAQENPWASIVGAKLYEVQPYIIKTNHIPFVATYVMNGSKYESMSDEQKLACDQFIEYCKRYTLAATPADDAALQATCEEYGCTVTDASDEVLALMASASEPVIEEMKASGDVDTDLIDTYVAAAEAASAN